MEIKISIVIPVYNVEAYLQKCLDSIRTQTFSEFEVILVDDGSSDGTGRICEEAASRDPRFRVIHQENQGVSAARNLALDLVRGTYVLFFDGDDYVLPETLRETPTKKQRRKKPTVSVRVLPLWRTAGSPRRIFRHLRKDIYQARRSWNR